MTALAGEGLSWDKDDMISSGYGIVCRLPMAAACLLLAIFLPWQTQAAQPSCGGVVRDTAGRLLPQVEIFLFQEPGFGTPVTERISDGEGRFDLGELLPGSYRLAALKEGYRLYLGRVDTLLQRSIQVILQPMPGIDDAGSEGLPGNASWSLRLPRRSLLRETGFEALAPPSRTGESESGESYALGAVLAGEIAHSFEARSMPGTDDRLVDAYGMDTSLNLTGFLTEHARVALQGRRRTVDRTGTGTGTGNGFVPGATADMNVGLQYDAGADDRIDLQAFFAAREPGRLVADPAAWSWGYDARWDRQLDGASRLAMRLGYRDGSDRGEPVVPSDTSAGRLVVLGGDFDTLVASGHQVNVGMEASLSQTPDAVTGLDTWTLRLRSEDAWSVTAPLTLVYGLEFRHQGGNEASGSLQPRIGAVWSSGDFALRCVAAGAFGYEAELEIPLPAGFRLMGEVARDPMAQRMPETAFGLPGVPARSYGDLLYEGRTASLVRDGASGRVALTWSDGDLNGLLGIGSDLESPVLLWAVGTFRLENLKLDLMFPSTGTELTLGVRETTSNQAAGETVQDLRNSRYSIHLMQDLYRPSRGAAWRLAVALISQNQTGASPTPEAAPERYSRNSMLNAGVSVVF
jgi:hypothetical protein